MSRIRETLGEEWYDLVGEEFDKDYMKDLGKWLALRRTETTVYPAATDLFTAFKLTAPSKIKVVVLGQDPYHDGCAHGLAFSCADPTYFPPSLRNILKELENDLFDGLDIGLFESPSLVRWAEQGVFMLNTLLSVEKGQPMSHAGKGWEKFTAEVIRKLSYLDQPIVWMLWGKKAQEAYRAAIPLIGSKHILLEAPHPSPFSAHTGFFGSKPFSKANEYLVTNGLKEIKW